MIQSYSTFAADERTDKRIENVMKTNGFSNRINFPFPLCRRKVEGEGGERCRFDGTWQSTYTPAHATEPPTRDSTPRQLVAILSNVKREFAESAATAAAATAITATATAVATTTTAATASAAGAATTTAAFFAHHGQLAPESDTGAESGVGATVAAEPGDPVAESAVGSTAATESAGPDGQRALSERGQTGGARGLEGEFPADFSENRDFLESEASEVRARIANSSTVWRARAHGISRCIVRANPI